ncbi:MAG: right-handed parallel beta-helix repeat-containing protein [Candidatus Sigynarchaeota archaeon]
MLAPPPPPSRSADHHIFPAREDFDVYYTGYNMTDADRWTGVPTESWCTFTLETGGRARFAELSDTDYYGNLLYYHDDPSPDTAGGVNVTVDVRPDFVAGTFNYIAIGGATLSTALIVLFDDVSGNIRAVDDTSPVNLCSFTIGNWYSITFCTVTTTTYDVCINGTLYDNGGLHFTNYDGVTIENITCLGIGTTMLEASSMFDVLIDNIIPSWYNATRIPITLTGDAEVAAFPGVTGAGTITDPFVISDLVIDAEDLYCGIQLRGITSYLTIRNVTVNDSRDVYTYDAGIRIAYCNHVTIENCTLNNTRDIAVFESSVTIINTTSWCTIDSICGTNSTINMIDCILHATSVNMPVSIVSTIVSSTFAGTLRFYGNATGITASNVVLEPGSAITASKIKGYISPLGNCTIARNIIDANDVGIIIVNSHNIIDGNRVENATRNGIEGFYSMYNVISNNIIKNVTGTTANPLSKDGRAIYMRWSGYNIIENNTITECAHGLFVGYSVASTISAGNVIRNNTFLGYSNTYNQNATNDPVLNHVGFIGIDFDERVTNTTITNNVFANMSHAIRVGDQACDYGNDTRIYYNTFINVSEVLYNPLNSNYTRFHHNYIHGYPSVYMSGPTCNVASNYYHEYFQRFPRAITTNVSMLVLEYPWAWNATLNDTSPLYYAQWYPRSQIVNIRAYSNVNGQGIPFENLKMYTDGVQISTPSPSITHVLFRLTIQDFRGRLLHDQVYNLNETTAYLNVGLDIAVQIFISYSSSLDSFGFDFTLARLYIDGVRCPISNPIMDHEIINFVVRDFAGRLLYNQTWNLTATGVYIDIPLAVTTLVVHNKFDHPVLFHFSIAGTTNTFPMESDQIIDDLRIALGTYSWWVTDLDGNILQDDDGDDIINTQDIDGPSVISFGWVEIIAPDPVTVPDNSAVVLILVLMLVGIFAAVGVLFVVAARMRIAPGKPATATFPRQRRVIYHD